MESSLFEDRIASMKRPEMSSDESEGRVRRTISANSSIVSLPSESTSAAEKRAWGERERGCREVRGAMSRSRIVESME